MHHTLHLTLTAGLAALVSACAVTDPPDLSVAPLGPIALADRLLFVDTQAPALLTIPVTDGLPGPASRLPLEIAPAALYPLADATTVLMLAPTARQLDLFDFAAAPPAQRSISLPAPFSALTVSDDGRFALAYHRSTTSSSIFHNLDEVALLDLAPTATTPTTARTLASLGGAPLSVHIAPPLGDRRFAFVLSQEHVAIVSLDHPTVAERSIPLVSLTSPDARTPTGIDFHVDSATSTLWAILQTAEASSVYALAVTSTTPTDPSAADFDVRLSQLPGAAQQGAAALVSLPIDGNPRLFSLTTQNTTGTLTLTDIATATGKRLTVAPGINRITLYTGPSGAPHALVWSSTNARSFHLVDLNRFWRGESRAFTTRTTRDPFTDLRPIPNTTRFLALHTTSDRAVSIIDTDSDRITSFGRTGSLRNLLISPDLGAVFLLTQLDAKTYLVTIDSDTLHAEPTPVADGASRLLLVPDSDTLVASAESRIGQLMFWPLAHLDEAHATQLKGFMASNLFTRTAGDD